MKSIFYEKPCDTCNADRQIGNTYRWKCECESCTKIAQWRNEVINRCSKIETVLGKEYDLEELYEIVKAKQDGHLVVLPCKPGDDLYWYDDTENVVKCEKCGVYGVVVTKEGFYVMENDSNMDRFGTQWTCLTADECYEKYGVKSKK